MCGRIELPENKYEINMNYNNAMRDLQKDRGGGGKKSQGTQICKKKKFCISNPYFV